MKLIIKRMALILILALIGLTSCQRTRNTLPYYTLVKVGDTVVYAEVSDTPEKRATGLQHRDLLAKDSGMFFVYEPPQKILRHWMKDMRFPLDIIWIDEKHKIVAITEAAKVCTKEPCAVFDSKEPAQYVLEVNAGFVQAHHLAKGMQVTFL